MKAMRNSILFILILALTGVSFLNAQPSGNKTQGISGLSEDQKTQIQKLRVTHLKDIQAINNLIGENRAHFKTLMTAENADMNAINKNIDEFGGLRSQLLKKQAAHIQDVRKLLSEEQRLKFDVKLSQKGGMQALAQRGLRLNHQDGTHSRDRSKYKIAEDKGSQN